MRKAYVHIVGFYLGIAALSWACVTFLPTELTICLAVGAILAVGRMFQTYEKGIDLD